MSSQNRKDNVSSELRLAFNGRNCFAVLARYQLWIKGQSDRLEGSPCSSANGAYLDGWYSPNAIIPDFVTHSQAAIIRHRLQFGEWPRVTRSTSTTVDYVLRKR